MKLSGTVPVIRCPRGNAAEIVSEVVLFSKEKLFVFYFVKFPLIEMVLHLGVRQETTRKSP